jgi:hypothetical protein
MYKRNYPKHQMSIWCVKYDTKSVVVLSLRTLRCIKGFKIERKTQKVSKSARCTDKQCVCVCIHFLMKCCRKQWCQPQSLTGSTVDWWTLWTVSRPTWTLHNGVILPCAFCLDPITELCNSCVCLTRLKRSLFLSYDYCCHVLVLWICGTLPPCRCCVLVVKFFSSL